jgi:hypothetical protein
LPLSVSLTMVAAVPAIAQEDCDGIAIEAASLP